ncbi:MAG: disulfide bond formation protein B [Paracoccaceae bacterium]
MMTAYGRMLLAAAGSAALLLAAFGFQLFGGLVPCELCVWQRWPHALAVGVGVLGITVLWRRRRVLSGLGAGLMAVSVAIAATHVGVEQGLWASPGGCDAPAPGAKSAEDLMAEIMEAPLVRCDAVAWSFLGLSMAAWNGLASLGLGALWAASAAWWRMPFERDA